MDLGLKLLSSPVGSILTKSVGWAAARRWPRPILRKVIHLYSSAYGVNLEEAAYPPSEYATFLDFFTRPLKPGLRPIDSDPTSFISPVDGALAACGPLNPQSLLQAKGLNYRMEDLVGSQEWAEQWDGGTYWNFYLHPADYHRFHAPMDVRIVEAVHLPGRLLPVNEWSRNQVPGLYSGNERIVVRALTQGGQILMVFVAATSVGRVRLAFDDTLTTHNGVKQRETRSYSPAVALSRADEIGRFELGSTMIVLAQRGIVEADQSFEGKPVRLGQRVGRLL